MDKNEVTAGERAYGLNRFFEFSPTAVCGIGLPSFDSVSMMVKEIKNGSHLIPGVDVRDLQRKEQNHLFRQLEIAEQNAMTGRSRGRGWVSDSEVSYVSFDASDYIHMMANHPQHSEILSRPFSTLSGGVWAHGFSLSVNYDKPASLRLPLYMSFITSRPRSVYDLYRTLRNAGAHVQEFINLVELVGVMEFDSLSDTPQDAVLISYSTLRGNVPDGTIMQWVWLAHSADLSPSESTYDHITSISTAMTATAVRELTALGIPLAAIDSAVKSNLDIDMLRTMARGAAA